MNLPSLSLALSLTLPSCPDTDFEDVWGFIVTDIACTTAEYYIIQVFKVEQWVVYS